MALTVGMATFDSDAPVPLAQWWADALGGTIVENLDDFFIMVAQAGGGAPNLGFQLVSDPTPGKNRIHLDLGSTDRKTDVERLLAAGASLVAEHDENPEFTWTTLADPQGNQFCVSDAQE